MLRPFGCNLVCLNRVKENEQSWGKHVNSVCLLVKNCPFYSPLTLYLIYCKKYLDESVADKKNDTHFKIITSCSAIMRTGLHTSYRLGHFSVSDKFLASFDEEYCTLGEESRSCSSEGFTPIDCSDTSTSHLTTMPITVLLEDTVHRLFSLNTVVIEDSQWSISHHAKVAIHIVFYNAL